MPERVQHETSKVFLPSYALLRYNGGPICTQTLVCQEQAAYISKSMQHLDRWDSKGHLVALVLPTYAIHITLAGMLFSDVPLDFDFGTGV